MRSTGRGSRAVSDAKGSLDMPEKLLILVGSPRRNGNSATLAEAVRRGAEAAGSDVTLRFLDDYISGFLRDCRQCRRPDGECAIDDPYRALVFDEFLPARGVIFCSPIRSEAHPSELP